MSYSRFAIYFIPPDGPLADFGSAWLGWDVVAGCEAAQLSVPGLRDITMTPMKYGFHGTLKPPFRLAKGKTLEQLQDATARVAMLLAPGTSEGLKLTTLGRFLALTPRGDVAGLRRVAEVCVRELDAFRSPTSEAELARRRKTGLSDRQEALLAQWGYPYVMEEFRFHLTLTGQMQDQGIVHWSEVALEHLPDLPEPFVIDQIALCGEREDGRFELIHRYALTG